MIRHNLHPISMLKLLTNEANTKLRIENENDGKTFSHRSSLEKVSDVAPVVGLMAFWVRWLSC